MMKTFTTMPHSFYFYLYIFIVFTGWFSSLAAGQTTNFTNATTPNTRRFANGTLSVNGTINGTNSTNTTASHNRVFLNSSNDYLNHNLDEEAANISLGATTNGAVLSNDQSRPPLLNSGQIAGIVVGSAAGLALVAGLLVFGYKRQRSPSLPTSRPHAAALEKALKPTTPIATAPTQHAPPAGASVVTGDGNPAAAQAAAAAAAAAGASIHRFQVSEAKPMMLTDDGQMVELKAVPSASPMMVQRIEVEPEQASVSLSPDGNLVA